MRPKGLKAKSTKYDEETEVGQVIIEYCRSQNAVGHKMRREKKQKKKIRKIMEERRKNGRIKEKRGIRPCLLRFGLSIRIGELVVP